MRRVKAGAGFTLFILFFGISFIEAIRSANWLIVAFWLLVSFVFLMGDHLKGRQKNNH